MLLRGLNRFVRFNAPEAAPGQPAAGAAPAPAPKEGAAPLPPAMEAAVKAMLAPVLQRAEAAEKALADERAKAEKAEADKATEAAAKLSVEEQLKRFQAQFNAEKTKTAISAAADRFQYTSPTAKEHAVAVFKSQATIEARENGDVVATIGGKTQPVATAFEGWFAQNGSIYKAAAAQPGAGAPQASMPDGSPKRVKDLSDAEFKAVLAQGVRGKLTNDAKAPTVLIQKKENPYGGRRDTILSQIAGK